MQVTDNAVAWIVTLDYDVDGLPERRRSISINPEFVAGLDTAKNEVTPLYAAPAVEGMVMVPVEPTGGGLSDAFVQEVFRKNCVHYAGNYEVTPGGALKIAEKIARALISPPSDEPAVRKDMVLVPVEDAKIAVSCIDRANAQEAYHTHLMARERIQDAISAGRAAEPSGPVPAHECKFRIGQAVHLASPYAEEDPSTIYYVAGIIWEHRAVPSRGWSISIATAEEINRGYGQTDGFAPSDLLPALTAAQEGR